MSQRLVHRFGVAAVRGVARNKNIAEFQLEPGIHDQQVVDGILAQLTADERRKFRVGRDELPYPSIELCPLGELCRVSLLMQCLCCVGLVLSHLYQRNSLSLPSWLCWLANQFSLVCGPCTSCRWWRAFLLDCLELQCCHSYTSGLCSTHCTCNSPSTAA